MSQDSNHVFTKKELIAIFDYCINKTLGEIDSKNVFKRTKENRKITGIAGDVIEQSVLKYPADQKQEPDLLVDGIEVELKTTGIRKIKKPDQKQTTKTKINSNEYRINQMYGMLQVASPTIEKAIYEAKEPMSITAVSPKQIVTEEFDNSNFWHKLQHLLLVYYLYDSDRTVPAAEYANFPIKGYEFHEFSSEDKNILQNDWQIVHDFIKYLQKNYENYENEYPRISHELRSKLMYIDTAPKWPNPPRFRLKRSVVTGIVQDYFGISLENLPTKILRFSDLDKRCSEITTLYKNKTIEELCRIFNITNTHIDKAIGEKIVIKMFNGNSSKMNEINIFQKIGLIGKTLILTSKNTGTEDMKLFQIDFEEIQNKDLLFEDSSFYTYFSEQTFLFILFKEKELTNSQKKIPLNQDFFLGFKRLTFDENFIQTEVKSTWNKIRDLVLNEKLIEVISYDNENKPFRNKNGIIRSVPNFPKSLANTVFVRGSGVDSSKKNLEINGIKMYPQYVWIKRTALLGLLSKSNFL